MDSETQQIITTAIAAAIRHALTIAAGSLVTLGWIQSGQSQSFVDIGAGIALGAIGYLWSLYQKKGLAGMLSALNFISSHPQAPAAIQQVAADAIAGQK